MIVRHHMHVTALDKVCDESVTIASLALSFDPFETQFHPNHKMASAA